jgi:hypothetical protein
MGPLPTDRPWTGRIEKTPLGFRSVRRAGSAGQAVYKSCLSNPTHLSLPHAVSNAERAEQASFETLLLQLPWMRNQLSARFLNIIVNPSHHSLVQCNQWMPY